MATRQRCNKFTHDGKQCPNRAVGQSDFCKKHSDNGDGGTKPKPPKKPSGGGRTTWEVMRDLIAAERIAELGVKVWEVIEQIIHNLPDLPGMITVKQRELIVSIAKTRDANDRRPLIQSLVDSLTPSQWLLLGGVILAVIAAHSKLKVNRMATKT